MMDILYWCYVGTIAFLIWFIFDRKKSNKSDSNRNKDQNIYDSGVFLSLDELIKVCGYFDFNADDYVCTHEKPPDCFDNGKGMCMSSSCPVANSVEENAGCEGDTSMQVYDPIVIARLSDSKRVDGSL